MVDDALGIAGRSRSVEQAERLPLVCRPAPVELGVALREQRFVGLLTEQRAFLMQGIVDVDDRDGAAEKLERTPDRLRELAIGDEEARAAVLQDERDRPGV